MSLWREIALSFRTPRITWLFIAPAACYVLLFLVVPYINIFKFSLWRVENYTIVSDMTLSNFTRVFQSSSYVAVIWTSLQIAFYVTLFTSIIGYAVALYVALFSGRARVSLFFFLVVPLWTSFLLRAFVWRLILGREGVLNSLIVSLGISDRPLDYLLFNKFSVVVCLVYVFVPFVALPIYAAIERVRTDVVEASLDLGATPFETFRRVLFPLTFPSLIAAASLTFCLSFGDFVAAALLGGPSGVMISNIIVMQFGSAFDWPFGSALALVVIGVVAICISIIGLLGRLQRV